MAAKEKTEAEKLAELYQKGQKAVGVLIDIGVPHDSLFPVNRVLEDIGARAANAQSMDGSNG